MHGVCVWMSLKTMKNKQTIELFCGTKSFSRVAHARGFDVFTVDNNRSLLPSLVADIRDLKASDLPPEPLILWASPPCTCFSVSSIGRHWTGGTDAYIPNSRQSLEAQEIVRKTISLIYEIRPTWWFIENPRGMLRMMPFMQNLGVRHTVTYCQYGDTRMKPTDIWTNATWWISKPMCGPKQGCHERSPRGSRNGTQGMENAGEKGRIPSGLFHEIIAQMAKNNIFHEQKKS